jgi:hypothetical protein
MCINLQDVCEASLTRLGAFGISRYALHTGLTLESVCSKSDVHKALECYCSGTLNKVAILLKIASLSQSVLQCYLPVILFNCMRMSLEILYMLFTQGRTDAPANAQAAQLYDDYILLAKTEC